VSLGHSPESFFFGNILGRKGMDVLYFTLQAPMKQQKQPSEMLEIIAV
jgi:hypothetical protein